jgi:DNA-binding NarL/FixJ family response regulator
MTTGILIAEGVRRILADHPSRSVVADAADGKEAINTKAIASKPDVAILDHSLPFIV